MQLFCLFFLGGKVFLFRHKWVAGGKWVEIQGDFGRRWGKINGKW